MNIAKCPNCEQSIRKLRIETLMSTIGNMEYKTAVFVCPHCQTILPAVFDPLALCNDIASAVKKKLQG